MQDTSKRAEAIVEYILGFLSYQFYKSEYRFNLWWSGIDVDVRDKWKSELIELVSLILAKEPYQPIKHHAASLGRIGGKVKSDAKKRAAKENGKKGGRPRKERGDYARSSSD